MSMIQHPKQEIHYVRGIGW